MKIVAGIDGGATLTRVVLADTTGKILSVGVSGPSNYGSVPKYKIRKHIEEAFLQAIKKSGLSPQPANALFLGMAGVVSKADRKAIFRIIDKSEIINSNNICVDHDIRISLAGGLAGKEGIALIVGTGSSCYGRTSEGHDWMSGGWGHLLDDRGSAYDLARRGLIAIVRASDGRGLETDLTDVLMQQLNISHINEIMGRIYAEGSAGGPMGKTEIASLASLVTKTAQNGDKVALQIVREGINELVSMVKAVAEQLNFSSSPIPLVISGGTVNGSPLIKDKLHNAITSAIPEIKIKNQKFSPVIGSALLALKMIGIDPDKNVIANMSEVPKSGLKECL